MVLSQKEVAELVWNLSLRHLRGAPSEGEYFMMGDNRDNPKDSRIFETVSWECIEGEAMHVLMPFDKADLYQPRWGRFFTGLK